MNRTIRLTEQINEMGNALTAAQWPEKAVHVGDRVKVYKTSEIYKDLVHSGIEMENMESELRDCVNELCLKCGNYREEHLGACDGCRWKEVKHGFR